MSLAASSVGAQSVRTIDGIGQITETALSRFGITTVKQLAEAEVHATPVSRIQTFISKAQALLKNESKQKQTAADETPEVKISFGGPTAVEDEPKPELEQKQEKGHFTTDHTWWEVKVLIPKEKRRGGHSMKEAIVYEMSMEPLNRIALLCAWVSDDSSNLCSMTYSPMYIATFNMSLPPLRVSLPPDDVEKLKAKHVLENVLVETNSILKCHLRDDDHDVFDLLKA